MQFIAQRGDERGIGLAFIHTIPAIEGSRRFSLAQVSGFMHRPHRSCTRAVMQLPPRLVQPVAFILPRRSA
jgi:hypothetical protein